MNIPMLLRCESVKFICTGCHRWYTRFPAFLGNILDKGDYCEHCGCTSFISSRGRPFGPKSRQWKIILDEWEWVYPTLIETPEFEELLKTADYDGVV